MQYQRGFQRGPDIGALMMMALLVGVIAWAVWVYGGAGWEKALVAAETVIVWMVGGLLSCLLIVAVAWARLDTAGMHSGGRFSLQDSAESEAPGELPGHAVLPPADADLAPRASLLFEPGVRIAGQVALPRSADREERVRLGEVLHRGDGYHRVAFEKAES